MGFPLDLSRYYRSPFGVLAQPTATPSFVADDDQPPVTQEDQLDAQDDYNDRDANGNPMLGPSYSASVSAGPRQKSASELRANQDYDVLRQALGNAPRETAPKWWQRGLGAVAGFGAGWSNAAGRSRHPIDIGEMRENVLHPGYQQKLQEWQSRVAPLQQIAALDRGQSDQERKDRQLDMQESWLKARAEGEHQRGIMWAARARAYDQGKIGSAKAASPTTQDLLNNIAQYEKALGRKFSDSEVNYYLLNKGNMSGYGGTLANPDKRYTVEETAAGLNPNATKEQVASAMGVIQAKRESDPTLTASRLLSQQATQQTMDLNRQRMAAGIEADKAKVFDQVRREHEALVKNLLAHYPGVASEDQLRKHKNATYRTEGGAALDKINESLASRLQTALDEYARRVQANGGTPEQWVIDPKTLSARKK